MAKKRLDVYIDEDLRTYITETAEREGKHLYAVTEELLSYAIAKRRGELIEQQSLPVIREIVQTELLKGMTQLRYAWRDDMKTTLIDEIQVIHQKGNNRLASLLVKGLRDIGIIRRLVYTLLAKAVGAELAQKVYEDAKDKAGKELATRSSAPEEDDN